MKGVASQVIAQKAGREPGAPDGGGGSHIYRAKGGAVDVGNQLYFCLNSGEVVFLHHVAEAAVAEFEDFSGAGLDAVGTAQG